MQPLPSHRAHAVLDALGNQTRRDILSLLTGGPLAVGAIAARLPVSRPAVSKHLRVLQEAGLVDYNARGRRNVFFLEPGGFRQAQVYLQQFWDVALSNFRHIAEGDIAAGDQDE